MMQRLLNSASRSIASGAVVLGLAGLLSRLIGVYRDRLLATTFGAGAHLDAYYAAFRIPDFVFNLLVLGALSAGFIPVFSEYVRRNQQEAWKLAQSVLMLLAISVSAVSVLIFLFAPWIVPFIAPGFDAAQLADTVQLTRIMLLSPIFLGISSVFGGVLQTFKKFLAYSLAPILYNLGIIFGLFIFVPAHGIAGIAWGVVLGAFLHLLLQYWIARQTGWTWSTKDIWNKQGIREILHLMGPRTASLILLQLNLLVITIFASKLAEGSVTIFNFANNLAHVPIGLFGISFAVSAFPVLSRFAAEDKREDFTRTIYKTSSQILFFLMPTTVFFMLFDEQIVRLVYGAGEFDWTSTLLTAKTLLYFIPGLIAQSLVPLLARAYYAQKDTKHPLYAALAGLIATFLLGGYLVTFVSGIAVPALGLVFSLGSLVQLTLLAFWLRKDMSAKMAGIRATIWQTVVAAGAMVLVIQFFKDISGPFLDLLTVRGVLLHLLLPALAGSAAYLLTLRHVENEEFQYYSDIIFGKLKLFEKAFVPTVATGEEDDTTL